jgi:hypothetical protein
MDQANQGGTHVGGKLWRAARTTSLIVALGLTGSLLVDLPASASANDDDQAKISYVPATGPWIKLGADRSDAQRPAAVTPDDGITALDDGITALSEETKQGRLSRNSLSGIHLAKGSRMTLSSS